MKRLLLAITLACVLSGTALAGDIPGVDSAAPAPSGGTQSSAAVTLAGDMPGVDSATASSGAQSSTVITLLLMIFSTVVK
ncbi:MAG: hypothetical protein QOF62_1102 [Pyrinomonadaceae bacterium]|nr:hypothetical protein [Pyrinomonadaceae bacterium]